MTVRQTFAEVKRDSWQAERGRCWNVNDWPQLSQSKRQGHLRMRLTLDESGKCLEQLLGSINKQVNTVHSEWLEANLDNLVCESCDWLALETHALSPQLLPGQWLPSLPRVAPWAPSPRGVKMCCQFPTRPKWPKDTNHYVLIFFLKRILPLGFPK